MFKGLPNAWGASAVDLARAYPADSVFDEPSISMTRAVSVDASAELTYRWMCQVSRAPYSYDLLDNLRRRSPQELTPGADELSVGQRVMVFELTDVQPGKQWTGKNLPATARIFGALAATYAVEAAGEQTSRIVCRMVTPRRGLLNTVRARLLAWGDVVMMRKQLLNLKHLAERDARRLTSSRPQVSRSDLR